MRALSEFLLARVAEDEAEARMWQERDVRWPTRRVLADCEARRRIIKQAPVEMGWVTAEDWLYPLLALPYADHPDYRDEWRP